MARVAKKKSTDDLKDFVPMERTRALLNEIWDHWRTTLGHTPEMAKRMMSAAVKEMQTTEKSLSKTVKSDVKKLSAKKNAVKKSVKKAVKKTAAKKLAAVKRKIK